MNAQEVPITRVVGDARGAYGRHDVLTGRNGTAWANSFYAVVYKDSSDPAICKTNGITTRVTNPSRWTENEALPCAWMHIRLAARSTTTREAGFINGPPKVEVLIKGMRLSYPINVVGDRSQPEWTDNTAIIRHWFETQIRGRRVNYTSFERARQLCGEYVEPESSPGEPYYDCLLYTSPSPRDS